LGLGVSDTSSPSGVFMHLPPDGFASWGSACTSFRPYANALLFTNSADVLSKGGNISMAQLPIGDNWTSLIPATVSAGFPSAGKTVGYNAVNSLPGSAYMSAINGSYMWRKPADDSWMSWLNEVTYCQGIVSDIAVNLQVMGPFVVFTTSIPNPQGQAGTWVLSMGVEVQSNATWIEQSTCPGSSIALLRLQDKIRTMPQFSENDLHWGQIWSNIKSGVGKAAGFVSEWAPKVAQVASTIGELLI